MVFVVATIGSLQGLVRQFPVALAMDLVAAAHRTFKTVVPIPARGATLLAVPNAANVELHSVLVHPVVRHVVRVVAPHVVVVRRGCSRRKYAVSEVYHGGVAQALRGRDQRL